METERGRRRRTCVAFGLVFVVIFSSLVWGCGTSGAFKGGAGDRAIVKETEKLLREKYGGEFTVEKIFGRTLVRIPGETEEKEETEMLVHPSKDERLLFEAKLLSAEGDGEKNLYDEYPAAWAGRIYEKRIRKEAGELLGDEDNWMVHVEAGSKSFPEDSFYLNNGRITPEEFVRRKPDSVWAISVAVSGKKWESRKAQQRYFQKVAKKIRRVSEDMRGSIYFYVLDRQKLQAAGAYLEKNAKVDYGFDRITGRYAAEISLAEVDV
ncbi:MAG: hypothetical protein K5744_02725 [Eubacterium sp.]|nr:hypothetical protein [Eubacterium sp.]